MKYITILSIFLAGCQNVTMGSPWPKIPSTTYLEPCKSLLLADKEKSMAELIDIIEANYGLWHECNLKNNSWIEWYNKHWKKEK